MRKIAIDIGGVLGPALKEKELPDGSYGMEPGPKQGALEALRKYVRKYGSQSVCILSRVSAAHKAEANWQWIRHWRVCETIGIEEDQVTIFVGDREEKAEYMRRFEIDGIIDDRMQILAEMGPDVEIYHFNPDPTETSQYEAKLNGRKVVAIADWAAFEKHFSL